MSLKDKKKLSCTHCRKIKRRCDGELPCSNCTRRSVPCEYNQTDRRSQRFSIGYIKSLETNNEVYENTLSELVGLRNDPDGLRAKLESLVLSFPLPVHTEQMDSYAKQMSDDLLPEQNDIASAAIVDDDAQYFGPGSIYHFEKFSRPDREPMLGRDAADAFHAVTLDEDYDYVADIVRTFFRTQYPNLFLYIFDKDVVLRELDAKNLDGPFLCPELVYAICANTAALSYNEADAYADLVLRALFMDNLSLSVAIAQCYTLLAIHAFSKGQISKGWLLAGLAIRVGLDVGSDMNQGEKACPTTNRLFMASILIDVYIAMAVGRRSSIAQYNLPILRLENESDVDYMNLKYCVELVEFSRAMVRTTYQPVTFDKDPKINYLLKFNRSKAFNVKMLKWKSSLDPVCHWLYQSMKSSKNLAEENHSVKYMYYYLLIFLNKPFLHVPKQHSTLYIIEEISKEMMLIISAQLEKMEIAHQASDASGLLMTVFTQNDKYQWASMDVCMLTILAHVIVTMMMSQPEHYLYLEEHFQVFVKFLNVKSPRKYKALDNPIYKLHKAFTEFKAGLKNQDIKFEDQSPAYDTNQLKESIELATDSQQDSSPGYSDSFSLQGKPNCVSESSLHSDEHASEHKPSFDQQAHFSQLQATGEQFAAPHPTRAPYEQNVIPMISTEQEFALAPNMPQQPQLSQMQDMNRLVPMYDMEPQMARAPGYPVYMPQQEVNQMQMDADCAPQYSHKTPQNYQQNTQTPMQPLYSEPQQFYGEMLDDPAPLSFHDYDQLPQSLDPVQKMMNSLFSNTGQEFMADRGLFNWNRLFDKHYQQLS